MVDEAGGFAASMKHHNPFVQSTYCCLHRKALVIKVLPKELSEKMNGCIHVSTLLKQEP